MEEFKKELDILLSKYPDLPEFSLKVQPRIVITQQHQKSPIPILNIWEKTAPTKVIDSKVVSSDVTALEAKVTPNKIRELSGSVHVEQGK